MSADEWCELVSGLGVVAWYILRFATTVLLLVYLWREVK
jgi:hypothetical protein